MLGYGHKVMMVVVVLKMVSRASADKNDRAQCRVKGFSSLGLPVILASFPTTQHRIDAPHTILLKMTFLCCCDSSWLIDPLIPQRCRSFHIRSKSRHLEFFLTPSTIPSCVHIALWGCINVHTYIHQRA